MMSRHHVNIVRTIITPHGTYVSVVVSDVRPFYADYALTTQAEQEYLHHKGKAAKDIRAGLNTAVSFGTFDDGRVGFIIESDYNLTVYQYHIEWSV